MSGCSLIEIPRSEGDNLHDFHVIVCTFTCERHHKDRYYVQVVKRRTRANPEGTNIMRIERYYNALLGSSRNGSVAPSINEARKDLNRAIEAQYGIIVA